MTFAMMLDIAVVVLLVPTIIFAVILNNRLSILRRNREELARLIAAFNEATVRAESGIPRLKKTSEEATKTLQEKVERAQVLRDDLAFMIERAEGMAARLEGTVRDARSEGARAPRGVSSPTHGMDIESAAEAAERAERFGSDRAAERAAERIAERFSPERERPLTAERERPLVAERERSVAPERERPSPSERVGIDRAALERMAEERGGLPNSGEGRLAPRRAAAAPNKPVERSRMVDDLPPEQALAERILAEHAENDFAASPTEGRRLPAPALPAPTRPAVRTAERTPSPTEADPPQRERPLTRSAAGTRPADRLPASPSPRVTRPGQVLGAALADDSQTSLSGASSRSPAAGAGVSRAGKDDDDRSEAERELLRALRSAR